MDALRIRPRARGLDVGPVGWPAASRKDESRARDARSDGGIHVTDKFYSDYKVKYTRNPTC